MSDEHDGRILEVRDKPTGRPDGWFAACSCVWTGGQRDRPGQALADLAAHLRTLAPTPKG